MIQHRANARNTNSNPIPIYVNGIPTYRVVGDQLRKRFQDKHILRQPKALAVDINVLDEAQAAGAKYCLFIHDSTGDTYFVSLGYLIEYGVFINRGFGEQKALPLGYWSVNGQEPKKRPIAVIEAEKAEEEAQSPEQLILFEVPA